MELGLSDVVQGGSIVDNRGAVVLDIMEVLLCMVGEPSETKNKNENEN